MRPPVWDVEATLLDQPLALEAEWRDLESRADGGFFLSWSWIGSWAESFAKPLVLVRAKGGGRTVALGLLAPARVRRHGLIGSRQLLLHASGDPDLDRIAIEYNGFLVERGAGTGMAAFLLSALRRISDWDECVLPGVAGDYVQAAERSGLAAAIDRQTASYGVSFPGLAGRPHIETLSANTRTQLRRALRLYEADGVLSLHPAGGLEEAFAYFSNLKAMDRWEEKGVQGAFATPAREAFHRRLIERAWPRGELELLQARAGTRVIGYLYHFLYRGRALSYQIAYQPAPDNRHHPGLVMHHLAIERARKKGFAVYDFLAGEARYKKSLGTEIQTLFWCRAQKAKPAFLIERAARRLKRALF
jgi:CelD/BcsL family acetyltransferase involved in cellulose biosynthesis